MWRVPLKAKAPLATIQDKETQISDPGVTLTITRECLESTNVADAGTLGQAETATQMSTNNAKVQSKRVSIRHATLKEKL